MAKEGTPSASLNFKRPHAPSGYPPPRLDPPITDQRPKIFGTGVRLIPTAGMKMVRL